MEYSSQRRVQWAASGIFLRAVWRQAAQVPGKYQEESAVTNNVLAMFIQTTDPVGMFISGSILVLYSPLRSLDCLPHPEHLPRRHWPVNVRSAGSCLPAAPAAQLSNRHFLYCTIVAQLSEMRIMCSRLGGTCSIAAHSA